MKSGEENKNKIKKRIIFSMLFLILILFIWLVSTNLNSFISNFYDSRANYYISKGNYKKVEALYKKKLSMQEKFFNNDYFALSASIANLINFYCEQRDYENAEKIYLKYLTSSDPLILSNGFYALLSIDLDKAVIYNSLANIYLNKKDYSKSEYYYNKAINIAINAKSKKGISQNKISNTINTELAKYYNNLGKLKVKQKKYKEAKKYFDTSIQLTKRTRLYKVYGEASLFQVYYELSLYYKSLGDYNKAEKYAEKLFALIPIMELPIKSFVNYQAYYMSLIANNLGLIYQKQKKYIDAKVLFKNALKLDTELKGQYNADVICDNYNLANLYAEIKDPKNYTLLLNKILFNSKSFLNLENMDLKNINKKMNLFCEY